MTWEGALLLLGSKCWSSRSNFSFKLGIGSALISHTSAATFHPAFTSLIGWRTNMHKAWCVLSKGEWNYVWTDIVSTFGNVQHKFQEDTRFVYTKLRLHPQQIIRVITIQLFADFSHIIQIWNKFKVISSKLNVLIIIVYFITPLNGLSRILKPSRLQRGKWSIAQRPLSGDWFGSAHVTAASFYLQ